MHSLAAAGPRSGSHLPYTPSPFPPIPKPGGGSTFQVKQNARNAIDDGNDGREGIVTLTQKGNDVWHEIQGADHIDP